MKTKTEIKINKTIWLNAVAWLLAGSLAVGCANPGAGGADGAGSATCNRASGLTAEQTAIEEYVMTLNTGDYTLLLSDITSDYMASVFGFSNTFGCMNPYGGGPITVNTSYVLTYGAPGAGLQRNCTSGQVSASSYTLVQGGGWSVASTGFVINNNTYTPVTHDFVLTSSYSNTGYTGAYSLTSATVNVTGAYTGALVFTSVTGNFTPTANTNFYNLTINGTVNGNPVSITTCWK